MQILIAPRGNYKESLARWTIGVTLAFVVVRCDGSDDKTTQPDLAFWELRALQI